MKRVYMVIAMLLVAAGCGRQETQVDTMVEVPVTVQELTPDSIEEYTVTTGTVTAASMAELTSEAAGYYRLAVNPATGRKYELGDRVAKDATIMYLDNPEQENAIKIESQKLALEIAQNEYDKQNSLYEKGGVTQSELRTAERSLMDAQYAYEDALLQLAKLKVTAPIAGIIVALPTYTEGVKVASGSEMATIMDYSTLFMETELPGTLLGTVKTGQELRVRNYSIPDSLLTGTITEISPVLDTSTRTFTARVSIRNANLTFRPGMFVKAEIITAHNDSTVVIPKDIILTRRNQQYVYVVDQGFARTRTIKTGLENPDNVEVVEGLEANDRLIIEGFETLRDGSKVSVTM